MRPGADGPGFPAGAIGPAVGLNGAPADRGPGRPPARSDGAFPVAGIGEDLVAVMTGFARTLRAAGVPADHERTQGLLRALSHLDAMEPAGVYWAGRLTLCASADDLPRYDRVFAAYFAGRRAVRARSTAITVTRNVATSPQTGPDPKEGDESPALAATASATEVLRTRNVARMTGPELAEVHRLLALLRVGRERRRSRRFKPSRRGRLDGGATIRETLRRGGEIAGLRYRAHRTRPRRVVLLVDVSGSMTPYADSLLRLAHALVRSEPRATEVFSAGTRLTRITAELRHRDPAAAMNAVSHAIPDWSGGTRLGEELRRLLALNDAAGATVVIASDGWERGDVSLLGAEMARLSRTAHRVIWVNPHKGQEGYQPLTAGMRAALPHIDDFVAGHSLAAFEELAMLLGGTRA
ncbi:VWA domain-containing protein [Streptosporangium sp. NBC_01755]|uniref:vWA domain-containing protein n=1 Tax=unclassified Streptosporangium TaxID=2632669 RepID=UPI002DDAA047|nr:MULTISPECIES: VWA domain-containing protein [unclassified Streptosporangium]WSA22868.1 VWA domain-containing protein [Streptosporangium sp. NBC_01810]WSC98987.1 VWA domain-containing protein [Streptosporangium sp. NBC_01755]